MKSPAHVRVNAVVTGNRAKGSVSNATLGVHMPFDATLRDDENIDWVYNIPNPFTGQSRKVPGVLTRQAAPYQSQLSSGIQRDIRLAGRWRRTVLYSGGEPQYWERG